MADTPPINQPSETRSQHRPTPCSRRALCRGAAVLTLPLVTGCIDLSGILGGDPGDVTIFNDTESAVSATISVTDIPEETTVLSETADIPASEAEKFNDVFDATTQYRFEVETADGRSNSYEWELPSTDHYLYVMVRTDSIDFEENSP